MAGVLWAKFAAGVGIPLILSTSALQAQEESDWQARAGGKMSFEVAFVKRDEGAFRSPSFALDAGDAFTDTGGRFSADFALATYITFAYKLSLTPEQRDAMLAQLPKWVREDRYDIQAKAAAGNPTKDQFRLMMQSLLAERFKLAVHFETRETSVLALVLVKPGTLGPKLRPHSEGLPCDAAPTPDTFPPRCGLMGMKIDPALAGSREGGSRDTTLPLIAGALPTMERLERPVVDQTGLSGRFDFSLHWWPETNGEPVTADQGPTFREALREQLGLKLESIRTPLQILVVDHVERPSEN